MPQGSDFCILAIVSAEVFSLCGLVSLSPQRGFPSSSDLPVVCPVGAARMLSDLANLDSSPGGLETEGDWHHRTTVEVQRSF